MRVAALSAGGRVLHTLARADDRGRVYELRARSEARSFADASYYERVRATLDGLEARYVAALRAVLVAMRDALLARVKRGAVDPRSVTLRGLPAFRSGVRDLLDAASARGQADARREVREARARVREYATADPAVFRPRNAAAWLRAKEVYVTDLLDAAVTRDVKGILVNGLKTGELGTVMADKIGTAFEAYLGDPDVLRDGEPLSPARLETIVRTNLTDAYNHGRMMTYTAPELLPFLNAIRYSAILDDRTTPVCRFLDGKLFTPEDPDLTDLLPPNHFNCRSIVVPVVVGEAIDQADFITPEEVGRARMLADAKFLAQEHAA